MNDSRDGVLCPICGTWYSAILRKPGRICGDWSQRQVKPCVGRVILAESYDRAEWRTGGRPVPIIRPAEAYPR